MTNILDELRTLAGKEGNSFYVRHGERVVDVAVSTDNDDDITGISLYVRYDACARARGEAYRAAGPLVGPRPMEITLRAETVADVVAKDQGVIVEWQSGDPAFDREVFVDSPVGDTAILGSVIGAELRAGVLELFAFGASSVEIDTAATGSVVVHIPRENLGSASPANRVLTAFERVIADLPAVTASGEKRPVNRLGVWVNRVLILFGVAGWLVNVGYAGGLAFLAQAIAGHPIEIDVLPVVGSVAFGIVAGLIFARFYAGLVRRSARGTSNAHTRARWAGLIGFAGFSVIAFSVAFVVALVLWGAAPKP